MGTLLSPLINFFSGFLVCLGGKLNTGLGTEFSHWPLQLIFGTYHRDLLDLVPRYISGSLVLTQPCLEWTPRGSLGAAGPGVSVWAAGGSSDGSGCAAERPGTATGPIQKRGGEQGLQLSLSESRAAILYPSRGGHVATFGRRADKLSHSLDHFLAPSELFFSQKPTQLTLVLVVRPCGRLLTPSLLLEYMCHEYFKWKPPYPPTLIL